MKTVTSETLASALDYAKQGWSVIPLHTIQDGHCTCENRSCKSPGKHPRTPHGVKDATTDVETIENWWRQWPDSNVGIATGDRSGMVAVDIDPRHDGEESMAALLREHGDLSETVEAETGGGGRHLIFEGNDVDLPNRSNLRPGIDIRGKNGYIVAPPSIHASGKRYAWREGHGPKDRTLAPMPRWLIDLIRPPEPAVVEEPVQDEFKPPGSVEAAIRSMWRMKVVDQNDGSKRLLAAACRAIEHNLPDDEAVDAIRQYASIQPFPVTWSNEQILDRIRDAEKKTRRGIAFESGANESDQSPIQKLKNDRLRQNRMPPFRPFPVNTLPEPVRSFVERGAAAIGCDESYLALPLLTVIASAIGNTRRIRLKSDWCEPPIVWTGIIGESGTSKTPAFGLALKWLHKRQSDAMHRYEKEMEQYKVSRKTYEKEFQSWKRTKDAPLMPPAEPEEPIAERWLVSDTTVEALAPILRQNSRGILLERDELAGWIGSFDRYAGGKGGADLAHWLSMHNAQTLIIDRKTGFPKTIHVPMASVSVTGGIQPGILRSSLAAEHRESGLVARFLFAAPPRQPKQWREDEVEPQIQAAMAVMFEKLFELNLDMNLDGDADPVEVSMSPEAKAVWVEFYNEHNRQQIDLMGDISAAWSKLEGYAARFALVVHMARWATQDPTLESDRTVDAMSIEAGITLSRWFGCEAKRIYAMIDESEEQTEIRQWVEKIQRMGGEVSLREWQRTQSHPSAKDAQFELQQLANAGYGKFEHNTPSPKGGRPSKHFILDKSYDTDKTPSGNSGSRVLSVSGLPGGSDSTSEWGEV